MSMISNAFRFHCEGCGFGCMSEELMKRHKANCARLKGEQEDPIILKDDDDLI